MGEDHLGDGVTESGLPAKECVRKGNPFVDPGERSDAVENLESRPFGEGLTAVMRATSNLGIAREALTRKLEVFMDGLNRKITGGLDDHLVSIYGFRADPLNSRVVLVCSVQVADGLTEAEVVERVSLLLCPGGCDVSAYMFEKLFISFPLGEADRLYTEACRGFAAAGGDGVVDGLTEEVGAVATGAVGSGVVVGSGTEGQVLGGESEES
ncbi:MAG: hypothetical protein WC285_00155 [Candidatus Gracilibacteria bacterium]|jgi:hypothetical protein